MYGHKTIGGYEKILIYGWDKNNGGKGDEGCYRLYGSREKHL